MWRKRVHGPDENTAGGAVARRTGWWKVVPVSALAGFAAWSLVATAASGSTRGAGEAAGPQPQPQPSVSGKLAALGTGVVDPADAPYMTPRVLKEVPAGPGKVSKPVEAVLTSARVTTALDADGIPEVAMEAYTRAANTLAVTDPACHMPWELLAAIGRVESDDGRFGGSMLLTNGNTTIPIYGIPLDGREGVALVRDTNPADVSLDGDPNFARAVGPMQFLPSTWAVWGADGNGDGVKDINNIFDAALGAADYLCAGGGNMDNPAQEAAAVLTYNDADSYVDVVLALAASYSRGDAATVPTTAGPVGIPDSGAGSTPRTPSSPGASAPAPARTQAQSPTHVATHTPAPQPAEPSSPAATAVPAVSPTANPAVSPTANPAVSPTANPAATPTSAPTATPAPAGTTADPTPSGQPSQVPVPTATPTSQPVKTADIGWAPAMRQVVVNLLTAPKTVCAAPGAPASCASDMATRPAEMQVSPDGTAVVKDISWTDWGSATAQGTGTLYSGGTGYPATITVSGITPYGEGTTAYGLVTVAAPDLRYNMSFTDGLVP